ncbi:hypothetical protein [Nocardia sp. NPDC049707]|uniref:hypothetical protein n=1 Tax=Nocardia sp. NPDC049707 TaxID=3154735 RepID=UPI00342C679A
MSEVERHHKAEIAPSAAALRAIFHERTPEKLALAPVDSVTLCHTANGITVVGEDGWCTDYDDTTEGDAIDAESISVVDNEKS